ncbi:MAG: DUF2264 domain-containing protein [Rariglobus sp.]|nr:DUF2264 domain-containing protein [Rariglobus sp.]
MSPTRARWIALLDRIVTPPLSALAEGRLLATLPLETQPGQTEARRLYASLEILGRSLAGLAPWLELELPASTPPDELSAQTRLRTLARAALSRALDPASPDLLNFTQGGQPLVDAAFLAHACLRAPRQLWASLSDETRARLLTGWRASRAIDPGAKSNWVLFGAMVETALHRWGGELVMSRVDPALRLHEAWYKGDGAYGDGPEFHWDYYNSFVIQPMLLDVLEALTPTHGDWAPMLASVRQHAVRYAAVQERLVAPDGSFPPLGRSLAYRCGAFQHLAQLALRQEHPAGVSAAQIRCALDAVIRRTLEASDTFNAAGWLQIGLAGHQPGLGEIYISTASLYLCTTAFLPLGLPANAPFWNEPDSLWTSARIWGGTNHPADHALH